MAAIDYTSPRWFFTERLTKNRFLRVIMPAIAATAMELVGFAVTVNMRGPIASVILRKKVPA